MKKSISTKITIPLVMLFILCITKFSFGQTVNTSQNNQKKEKIEAAKIAYMTDKLQLSPAEAEKFWPVYNEYDDKKESIQKTYRKLMKTIRPNDSSQISEIQADEIIELHLQNEQQLLDLKKEYFPKLKKTIGAKKVVEMFFAEKEFNKLLLERLKENKTKAGNSK